MSDSERKILDQILAAEPTTGIPRPSPDASGTRGEAACESSSEPPQDARASGIGAGRAHPVVWLDPDAWTGFAMRRLRRHAVPLHVIYDDALQPAAYARGVTRHRMPSLRSRPDRWLARLLELAARVEPKPVLIPGTTRARELLRHAHETLAPHFALAHLMPLGAHDANTHELPVENAVRRALVRGEPAFDMQVTLDGEGRCNAACVLTWVAGVPPHVVVTSVEGHEILERGLEWLRARRVRGYARLVWSPDRFGRIELQAADTLPGSSLALAAEDGVDFSLMTYACIAGIPLPAQFGRRTLSCSVRVAQLDADHASTPLLSAPRPGWREEPWARAIGWLREVRG